MTSNDPRIPWLKLASALWIGETVKAGLIKKFEHPDRVFSESPAEISQVKGWQHDRLERFIRERTELSPICNVEVLEKNCISTIFYSDPEYPPLLRQIHDSPIVLFAKGKPLNDNRPHLAMVGARNATQMGFDIARQFGKELAEAGFVIVSGLALGIDTFAHMGALEGNSRTIAVLGCGVDVVYPAGNRKIRKKIEESGMVISEFPPGTPARPWHFPIRNRIISGMCLGTLVVEATSRSGSLITARMAADQNREVFAIPGSIRSNLSKGTHSLIDEGAYMVTEPQQLIDHFSQYLPIECRKKKNISHDLSPEEEALVEVLRDFPIHLDKLLEDGRWTKENLFSMLLTLELRDVVIKYPGNFFQAKL